MQGARSSADIISIEFTQNLLESAQEELIEHNTYFQHLGQRESIISTKHWTPYYVLYIHWNQVQVPYKTPFHCLPSPVHPIPVVILTCSMPAAATAAVFPFTVTVTIPLTVTVAITI